MLVDSVLAEPKTKILPSSADDLLGEMSGSGSEASVDNDALNSSHSTITPQSPGGSETNSLTTDLGTKFKSLGYSKEDWPAFNDSSK